MQSPEDKKQKSESLIEPILLVLCMSMSPIIFIYGLISGLDIDEREINKFIMKQDAIQIHEPKATKAIR